MDHILLAFAELRIMNDNENLNQNSYMEICSGINFK